MYPRCRTVQNPVSKTGYGNWKIIDSRRGDEMVLCILGIVFLVTGIILPIFTIHSTIKSYYSLESLAGNIIDSLLNQKMPNVTVPSSAIIWVIITAVLFAAAAVCFSMAANTRTKNKKRKQKLARAKVLVLVSGIICGIAYPMTLLFRMLCNVDIMVYYQSYDRLYYGGIAALIISIISGIILVLELFKIITNI